MALQVHLSVKETQLPEKYQNNPRIVDVKVPNYKEGTIDKNKEILRSVYGWSDEKIKEYTEYSNTIASAEAMFDYLERFDIDPENVGAKGIANTLMSLRPRNKVYNEAFGKCVNRSCIGGNRKCCK